MNNYFWRGVLCVSLAIAPVGFAGDTRIAPDLSRINDKKIWSVLNADSSTAMQDGKRVVRLKSKGKATTPSDVGLALVEGLEFTEGTLEIDLKGAGKEERIFLGLAFSAADEKNFEAVYFRPFNFMSDDKQFRERAVQYVAWPDHTWEKLRAEKPGVYESAVKPVPDPSGWFHARVEVNKKSVRVWVDDAKEPCLVVDRLASREKGKVGLWVDSREGTFSNLQIQPPERDVAKEDLEKMKGDWTLVFTETNGNKLTAKNFKEFSRKVAGETYSIKVESEDGVQTIGIKIVRLDPSKSPKAIDVEMTDGTAKGKSFRGIYKFEDDTQVICLAGADKDRPAKFDSKEGTVTVWKRDKAPVAEKKG
jgi:uncharacterized protein (TIGR03067 family)